MGVIKELWEDTPQVPAEAPAWFAPRPQQQGSDSEPALLPEPAGPRSALTPCAPLPVLLAHGQQLLHAVVHGSGEFPDSFTLLLSVGETQEGRSQG